MSETNQQLRKRLAALKSLKRKAAIEDEEEDWDELYRERQEFLAEEESAEEEIEELKRKQEESFEEDEEYDVEQWRVIAEHPDTRVHELYYEESPAYREWYEENYGEKAQTQRKQEEQRVEEKEQSPEQIVENQEEQTEERVAETEEERLEVVNEFVEGSSEYLVGVLNLSKEEASALLEEDKAYTLEEFKKEEELANPETLIQERDAFQLFTSNQLDRHRSDLLSATDRDELAANKLGRAFFGYIPPALLREYYGVGVQDIKQEPSVLLKELDQHLKVFDDLFQGALSEKVEQFAENDKEKFTQGANSLLDLRENLSRVLKDATSHAESIRENTDDPRFQLTAKKLLSFTIEQLEDLDTLRSSFPQNAEYGVELDELAAPLVNILTSLQEFAQDPSAVKRVPSKSFLAWHDKYQTGDERFDQMYNMIYRYTMRACQSQLWNYPQLLRLPGVESADPRDRAGNLLAAVMYGLNLQHSEDTAQASQALRETDEKVQNVNGHTLDDLLEMDSLSREKVLQDLPPIRKKYVEKLLDKREKAKKKIDRKNSVLNKIQQHVMQTGKATMVCPKCDSSWWSFQSASFPNASADIFNANILPRLKGRGNSPEVQEELRKTKNNIMHEWRQSPFKAPEGIIVPGQGRFCGGLHDGADAEEVINKIRNAAALLDDEAEAKRKEIAEYEAGTGYSKEFYEGPFNQAALRRGDVVLDKNQIVRIFLPTTTMGEVESNIKKMEEAIISGESIEFADYRLTEYNITITQFNQLRDELEGQMCFNPKKNTQRSLAQVIFSAVKGAALQGLKTYKPYTKKGLQWTCPSCGRVNEAPISPETYAREKNWQVICESSPDVCPNPYHELSDVQVSTVDKKIFPKSIDFRVDDDAGSIADTIEGPNLGAEAIAEIEEVGKDNLQQLDSLRRELNRFGTEKEWEVQIAPRTRKKMKISFPNLGDVLFQSGSSSAMVDAKERTLEVAQELGFIFPFAICNTCNTIHPTALRMGAKPRCVHVEQVELFKQMTMNEVARVFKEITRTNPKYPPAHIPDFEYWKEQWDSQFRLAAATRLVKYAATEDDFNFDESLEEQLAKLHKELDEPVEPVESTEEAPEEEDEIGSLLESIEDTIAEPEPEATNISEDDFFAAFDEDEEEDTSEDDQDILEDVTPVSEPSEDEVDIEEGESKDEDEFFVEVIQDAPKQQKAEDAFEVQILENALQVLPVTERARIWGSDMEAYYTGTDLDQIPVSTIRAVQDLYNISNIKAIVNDPVEVVNNILDDARKHLMEVVKDSSEAEEDLEVSE